MTTANIKCDQLVVSVAPVPSCIEREYPLLYYYYAVECQYSSSATTPRRRSRHNDPVIALVLYSWQHCRPQVNVSD